MWNYLMPNEYYEQNADVRLYHNIAHAYDVIDNIYTLTPEPSQSLLLAALWHDAVYFPGAGSDANERCSSVALALTAIACDKDKPLKQHEKDIVNAAQSLIENTHIGIHLISDMEMTMRGDLAILLDADIASLALPYEQFLKNQKNIIIENNGDVIQDDYKKSAEFLSNFLTVRKFIYHTEKGRELWEKSARKNIKRYCKEYS